MAASTTRRRVQLGYELQDVNWGWSSSGQLRIFPYSVQMRKIRTKKTPSTDTFHAVLMNIYVYYQQFPWPILFSVNSLTALLRSIVNLYWFLSHVISVASRCNPDPCLNEGKCFEGDNNFICECKSGYSGKYCEGNEYLVNFLFRVARIPPKKYVKQL